MAIKLVALDMDGTLLNEHQELNPAVAATIRTVRAAGVYVVLASGRPLPGTLKFLPELDLLHKDDYVITYNGALVQQTRHGDVLIEHPLSYQDYLHLYATALANNLLPVVEDRQRMYTDIPVINNLIQFEAFATNMPIQIASPAQISHEAEFAKFHCFGTKDGLTNAIANMQPEMQNYYGNRAENFLLEFVNKEASKGKALRELAGKLGIDAADVMAMGDSHNDESMFEFAGTGIAMGNAIDELKAMATGVTATNVEDGVAVALKKYVLNA